MSIDTVALPWAKVSCPFRAALADIAARRSIDDLSQSNDCGSVYSALGQRTHFWRTSRLSPTLPLGGRQPTYVGILLILKLAIPLTLTETFLTNSQHDIIMVFMRSPREQSEAEFLKSYDASRYERPSVTVDMVIFTVLDRPQPNYRKLPEKDLCVLLIKRGGHPFKDRWALPGGFVSPTESPDQAAVRELAEETGVENVYLEQLYTWGDPGRDPRTWVISCSYMALIDASRIKLAAGDDAVDAQWFRVSKKLTQEKNKLTRNGSILKQRYSLCLSSDELLTESQLEKTISTFGKRQTEAEQILVSGELAFDHARMISYAVDRLRNKIEYTDLAFNLMPEYFTLTQLQQVYETILDCELLKANFRRKIENKVVETDQFTEGDGYRPSRLFKMKRNG